MSSWDIRERIRAGLLIILGRRTPENPYYPKTSRWPDLSSSTPLQYERLEVYGFRLDYPTNCLVEFNPKSDRHHGDVALKSSSGYKIFLSWGALSKLGKLQSVEAHADYSLGRVKGSREASVKDVTRESIRVNGHPASFNHVKLELVRRGIFFNTTRTPQEVRSLHVHCQESSRYFVLYGPVSSEKSGEQGEVVSKMVASFACH